MTESKLLKTQAELTVVDGKVQYAAKQSFPKLHKPLQKALPAWSPVNQ